MMSRWRWRFRELDVDAGGWRRWRWQIAGWFGWESWVVGLRTWRDHDVRRVEFHAGPFMLSIDHTRSS